MATCTDCGTGDRTHLGFSRQVPGGVWQTHGQDSPLTGVRRLQAVVICVLRFIFRKAVANLLGLRCIPKGLTCPKGSDSVKPFPFALR
jgi:hypothetical protein